VHDARGENSLYGRQTFAAYATAIGQRGLAALGGITVQKPVLAFATNFRRLILAFHKFKFKSNRVNPAKNRSLKEYQRRAECQGEEMEGTGKEILKEKGRRTRRPLLLIPSLIV
jgi:hypothetical protein